MKLTTVKEIYKEREKYLDKEVTVGGWVRSVRDSKTFGFIVLHDGSFFETLQVVYHYLELEILTDTEEKRTEALKQIEDVLEALGYSMEDTTRTSYLSMLMKKEKDGKDAQSNGLY